MSNSDAQRIAEHLGKEQALLDELFGPDGYLIKVRDPDRCELRSDWVEVTFAYDRRDRWIDSAVELLFLPDRLRDLIPSHLWPPFTGSNRSVQSKGPLDAERVRAELRLVEQIVRAELEAPGTLRDWAFFTWGYNRCYNDRVSADFRNCWRMQFLERLIGPDHSPGDAA
jgi:hypothetical protein